MDAEEGRILEEMVEEDFKGKNINPEDLERLKKQRLETYIAGLDKIKKLSDRQKEHISRILDAMKKDSEERKQQRIALEVLEIIKTDERFGGLREILSKEKGINL